MIRFCQWYTVKLGDEKTTVHLSSKYKYVKKNQMFGQ